MGFPYSFGFPFGSPSRTGSNFVDNDTSLAGPKVTLNPPPAGSNLLNYWQAQDYNAIAQALGDIRTVLYRNPSIMEFGGDNTGVLDNFAALTAAVTAGVSSLQLPQGTYSLATNFTVPAGVTLVIDPGAIITIADDVTLTFQQAPHIGHQQQCFAFIPSPSATPVVFSAEGSPPTGVLPQWFGAAADGTTNDSAPITQAIASLASGGALFFPAAAYRCNVVVAQAGLRIAGAGNNATILRPYGATPTTPCLQIGDGTTLNIEQITIENLSLVGVATAAASDGLKIYGAQNVSVRDVFIADFGRDNISITSGSTAFTNQINFVNCYMHRGGGSGTGAGACLKVVYSQSTGYSTNINLVNCYLDPGNTGATTSSYTIDTDCGLNLINVWCQGTGTTKTGTIYLRYGNYAAGQILPNLYCQNCSTDALNTAAVVLQIDQGVSTSVTGHISSGSQTVTPASMTGIYVGTVLTINQGFGDAENVTVTAVNGGRTTFTATFATHTAEANQTVIAAHGLIDGLVQGSLFIGGHIFWVDDGTSTQMFGVGPFSPGTGQVIQYGFVNGALGFANGADDSDLAGGAQNVANLSRRGTGASQSLVVQGAAFAPQLTYQLPLQGGAAYQGALWQDVTYNQLRWLTTEQFAAADTDGFAIAPRQCGQVTGLTTTTTTTTVDFAAGTYGFTEPDANYMVLVCFEGTGVTAPTGGIVSGKTTTQFVVTFPAVAGATAKMNWFLYRV